MLVIDPRAGAGLRPYRVAFKANYITAAGSLCPSVGLSLAMREVACGTLRTARAGVRPGRTRACFSTSDRVPTEMKRTFSLTSASTSYRSLAVSRGMSTVELPSR